MNISLKSGKDTVKFKLKKVICRQRKERRISVDSWIFVLNFRLFGGIVKMYTHIDIPHT
jgi:hypothetical protein